jgi:hypothetical protein
MDAEWLFPFFQQIFLELFFVLLDIKLDEI